MIESLIRPELLKLQPYTSARHLHSDGGLLLDANENAFGSLAKGPKGIHLNRYPDPYARELRRSLAKKEQLSENEVFIGSGSDEIVDLLIRLFVASNEEILTLEPTYGMYQVAGEIHGITVNACLLDDQFQINLHRVQNAISNKTKLIFCCSPNNPTGNTLREESLVQLCKTFGGIVVLDEAYIEFASTPSLSTHLQTYKNLVILRTFSKAWGLAGLRVGYGLMNSEIVEYLNKIKPPYHLNTLSAYFAHQTLQKRKPMLKWRNKIVAERQKLEKSLTALGCFVFPSQTNFLLVRVANASEVAKSLAEKYGVIIRDVSKKPLLQDCLRMTVGTPAQNKQLLKGLGAIL